MQITGIDKGGRTGRNILFCLVVSAVFLAIGSRSSPLYPTNDWVDANAFFTMGKGMMRGLVLYRDLFEQKGPLLYFLHGLASLVSFRSFFGVYLLEILSFTAFLVIAGKWITEAFSAGKIPLDESHRAAFNVARMILQVLLAFVIINAYAFALGDSAEELYLPLFAAGGCLLMRRFRSAEDDGADAAAGRSGTGGIFVAGILAGCVLWIKFSLLGFWLGWILAVLLELAYRRRFRQAIVAARVFLGGMLAATIPWLVYFGFHGALGDLVVGVYGGGRSYVYYFLAFSAFAVPGCIWLLPILVRLVTFVMMRVDPDDPGDPDVQGYREDVYRYLLFELRKET